MGIFLDSRYIRVLAREGCKISPKILDVLHGPFDLGTGSI
jgi:hypothetical protein